MGGIDKVNPKISIIVPVFNVESYLNKCIESILCQSFTNFELILVNDGSPDNCGEICEQYALLDNRIKVIHKENGGQASARNTALNVAKGEYIGFVDSDDWIEPDMYEILYEMCIKYDCDIANITSIIHYGDHGVQKEPYSLIIHNKRQAMETLLVGDLYDEVVWTKLIKSSLLKEVRFKEGILYEDTDFTYRVFHECKKICAIGMPKYHYIKHGDSSMAKALKNYKMDALLIYDEMYQFINKHYPELTEIVLLKFADNAIVLLENIMSNPNWAQHKDKYLSVALFLNKYFHLTIRLKKYSYKTKILLLFLRINPLLYKVISTHFLGRRV